MQNCANGYCATDVYSTDLSETEQIQIEKVIGGEIITSQTCHIHCHGLLTCHVGYVYDSPFDGPVAEIGVIFTTKDANISTPKWILTDGHDAGNCRPGPVLFFCVLVVVMQLVILNAQLEIFVLLYYAYETRDSF